MTLVQPILVTSEGSHEDIVMAVVLASIGALEEISDPNWAAWAAGQFTKSVRRVKREADMVRAMDEAEFHLARVRTAKAVAFAPMVEFPKTIARARVKGLDATRSGSWWTFPGAPTVALNPDVKMSTGKTAAQAAHAAMAWRLKNPTVNSDIGLTFSITDDRKTFNRLNQCEDAIRINDAGLTELTPGTLTAIVGRV